jgi:hypothetical protein
LETVKRASSENGGEIAPRMKAKTRRNPKKKKAYIQMLCPVMGPLRVPKFKLNKIILKK